jgi:hypothetical protein
LRGVSLREQFEVAEGLEAGSVSDAFCPDGTLHDLIVGLEAGRPGLGCGFRAGAGERPGPWRPRRSNSVGSGGYEEEEVSELFAIAIISPEVGLRKPDPAIYALVVKRIGLPPEELVFVDDLRANLAPADAVGIATVLHQDSRATVDQMSRLLGAELTPV